MPGQQGHIELLVEPAAQRLLESKLPAHLAYTWSDGTPRVIPIGFHWNGQQVVVCSAPDAPKMKVLRTGTKVALTIESERDPLHVLLIRGSLRVERVAGLAPEYIAMTERTSGPEQARAWLDQMRQMWAETIRMFIEPEWVGLLDFQTRFPSAVERGQARLAEAATQPA